MWNTSVVVPVGGRLGGASAATGVAAQHSTLASTPGVVNAGATWEAGRVAAGRSDKRQVEPGAEMCWSTSSPCIPGKPKSSSTRGIGFC